jgi:hypothetical protein
MVVPAHEVEAGFLLVTAIFMIDPKTLPVDTGSITIKTLVQIIQNRNLLRGNYEGEPM